MNLVKFKIYKLHFTAPLHIGGQRCDASISQRSIHSDTFYAALISCLAKVGREVPENGDLGCVISDLFPYYQQEAKDKERTEPTYFLPMPFQASLPQLPDPADAKKVKKVQWVDVKLYGKLLQGKKFFEDKEKRALIQPPYLTETKLPEDAKGSIEFVKSEVVQRIKIDDRIGKESVQPYYVDRISFKEYSGLYFLVYGDTRLLDETLQILKNEGIGMDRNVGYGFFDVEDTDEKGNLLELAIETPEATSKDADCRVTLSMFIPESMKQLEELLNSERVAYDFVRRGGWITTFPYTTLRKNAIYAFLPGSVFHKLDNNIVAGRIVDLRPGKELKVNHSIWRNGKSIMLPIISR